MFCFVLEEIVRVRTWSYVPRSRYQPRPNERSLCAIAANVVSFAVFSAQRAFLDRICSENLTIIVLRGYRQALLGQISTHLTNGCASRMALMSVVPERGTPPININGVSRLYWYTWSPLTDCNAMKMSFKKYKKKKKYKYK